MAIYIIKIQFSLNKSCSKAKFYYISIFDIYFLKIQIKSLKFFNAAQRSGWAWYKTDFQCVLAHISKNCLAPPRPFRKKSFFRYEPGLFSSTQ